MKAATLKEYLPQATLVDINLYIEPLTKAMAIYEINTPKRIAAFLANVAIETKYLKDMSENLNYSAEGLLRVFGKYFTKELAAKYARNPEAIANRVYANRYGNGDEASGDGWKFRGRGFLHTTFHDNYKALSGPLKYDLVKSPQVLATAPGAAVHSGCLIWKQKGCNEIVDSKTFTDTCKRVNGGTNGLEDRIRVHNHICQVMGISA